MPPHGRRRTNKPIMLFFLWCVFASAAHAASSAVLGIDLGTEYIKAALVKPGVPLDIVLTKDSKRKETAAVAFKSSKSQAKASSKDGENFPERAYGGDALALAARMPKDVYSNLKPLLGLSHNADAVHVYADRYPELSIVQWGDAGTVGFKSNSFVADEEPFSVEELLAMELKNIKSNAEKMAGKGYAIQDVVITVPSFYTVEERRAITSAAELAGLRVVSLISDGLAVGLNYATSRTFPIVNEGGKPETHIVFDMGARSTTATVLRFQGRKVKDVGKFNKTIQEIQVLGTSWDKTLGGDAMNDLILDDIVSTFVNKPEVKSKGIKAKQVKSHGRTMAKLWKESERIRQVLSANSATSTNFEGLYEEDQNLKYKMSRNAFEEKASNFISRIQVPVQDALSISQLTMDDIDSIILHGGAIRTPFVQKQLEVLAKGSDKIRTNVNSDEAAAFGAGFKAAAISPSFRVKEIRTYDNAVFPVTASWIIDGKEKQQKLFIPSSTVGTEKSVVIRALSDFSIDLSQSILESTEPLPITKMQTMNLTDSVAALTKKAGCASTNISTAFNIRLSTIDGLPEITGASVSCEEDEVEKKGVVDGMKDFLGFGSKKEDQKVLGEVVDEEAPISSSSSVSLSSTSDTASSSTSASDSSTAKTTTSKAAKASKNAKKKLISISVGVRNEASANLNKEQKSVERMDQRLMAFDASDRARVLREETLNNLEAYTYKIRDLLEDEEIKTVSTAAQREELQASSSDASAWIYADGASANRDALKARLDKLRNLVKPIEKRKEELKKRPDAIQILQESLKQAKFMADLMSEQMKEAASAAAAASASQTSSTSQSSSTTSTSDALDDLDDDTSTTAATTSTTAISDILTPVYTEKDLSSLLEGRDATQKWLEEKMKEQDKLSVTDDPVLSTSDLFERAKELNELVTSLAMKKAKTTKPRASKKKSKSSKPTTSTSSSSPTSTEESPSPVTADAENTAPASSDEVSTSSTESASTEPSATEPITESEPQLKPGWGTGVPINQQGADMPSPEEEFRIRQIQAEIDESLAASKRSIMAKATEAENSKSKTAKVKKSKTRSKTRAKSKSTDAAKSKIREEL